MLLLHDNARSNTAHVTQQKLVEIYCRTLEHPSYSPDLSLCDFHTFEILKELHGDESFENNDQVGKILSKVGDYVED